MSNESPAPKERLARIANYVQMRNAKPMNHQDDRIHGVHFGTEWEGELLQSDIEAALACIREQQAALETIARTYSYGPGEIARAALTKWRIE